jgi:excisionase family DNA binding protein
VIKPQIVICSKIPVGLKNEYIGAPTFIGNHEHLWTCSEVADYIGVHVETIRLWVRSRKISFIRLGRVDVRFRRSDIDEFLQSRLKMRKGAYR